MARSRSLPQRATDQAPSKSPVRARGVRTRAKLIDAARRVFERDGYLEARVADIAAAAKVAHGSFYTYFDSKEDVFREMATGLMAEFETELEPDEEGDAAARIRAANRRYLDFYRRRASIMGVIEQVGALESFRDLRRELRNRTVQRMEDQIRTVAAAGDAALDGLDPHVLASALVGMLDSFAYVWYVLGEPFDERLALTSLDGVVLRTLGVSADAPRAARRAPAKRAPATRAPRRGADSSAKKR
jgi:AcrR family transcriptional regulator